MKKITLVVVSALLVQGCISPQIIIRKKDNDQEIKRIAIMPFKTVQNIPKEVGEAVSDIVTTQALKLSQYEIIERSQINKILKEQNFSLSGIVSSNSVVEIGKLLGVDAVMVGSVTEYKQRKYLIFPPASFAVTLRLVNVKTGSIIMSATHRKSYGFVRWVLTFWPVPILSAFLLSASIEKQTQQTIEEVINAISAQIK